MLARHPAHVVLGAFTVGALLTGRTWLAALGALLAATTGRLLGVAAGIALVAGSLLGGARLQSIDRTKLGPLIGSQVDARGYLARRERSVRGESRVRIELTAIGLVGRPIERVDEVVQLRGAQPAASIGDELQVEGRLTPLPEVVGADFDYAAYLRRGGVHAVLRADRVERSGRRRGGAQGAVDAIRRRAEVGVGAGLPPPVADLARGMVLGADERIPKQVSDDFKDSGLAHLLAVSGQNVMLLALLAFPALGLLGIGRRARLAVVLALIAMYVPLTGAGPSILRAGVMGAAAVVAGLSGRPASRWYALLMAAAVTLAIDPRAWQDVGWQLSFAAVVGIFAIMPSLQRRFARLPQAVRDGLAMTVAATLATAPLMAFQFGRLSLVSVIANLIALPAVAPVMWLGMISAAVAQVSVVPAHGINLLAGPCLAYVAQIAAWAADAPLAVISIGIGSPLVLAAIYGVGGLVAWRPRRVYAVLAVLVLLGLAWHERPRSAPPPRAFEVTFLDVGQGDATLLRTPAGSNVLFDCGPPEAGLAGKLERLGIRRLDLLVATHPQRDHDGGCPEVRKRLAVGRVLDRATAGEQLALGRLRLRVLSPAQPYDPDLGDPNLQAIVALASYGATDVLLTADAESEVTGALALPRVELLKVAHHGSDDPGLPELLARTQPRLAAIEVGAGNRYGHPTPATLAALRVVPSVYRTDRDGDVRVLAAPGGLEVDRSK